ncbi:M48 family metallopeptidase [Usitatibacter palustris]|uniref:Protease HtpX n=1 Tax=Usitatibacter palustris TaxID=2732487 RepID=A0A6M4H773_9PROT|nr:M48 family metallopeptidase [Usitatibacter palustris]QJR14533.1 Protease HtpX [Usitatibacter palustris]
MNTYATIFLAFLAAGLAARAWLALRHARHVTAHRDQVPADFAAIISPEAHRKAADYTLAKLRFALIEMVVLDGALVLLLTLGGGLAALDSMAARAFGDGALRGLVTPFALMAVMALNALPFDLWRTFVIEERYGFNKTTPATFFGDLIKGAVLSVALGAPLLLLIFWFVSTTGALWWLYTWIAWVVFTGFLVAAYPRWIAPLFNKFTPLEEGEVRRRIEALLGRCGFRADGLFVMDGSKRSSHGNAYFTGLGRTKRIVFFDTLLERLTPEEIEAVLAHELGHFARGHIPRMLLVRFALAFVLLAFMGWLLATPGFAHALGLGHPAHIGAALAGFALVLPALLFPFQPIGAVLSRKQEFEADAYAAQHASATGLVTALTKLYRDNAATLTPDPLHSLVYDSHPPAAIRIAHLRNP